MTTRTEDLRLAADFAPATQDDWRKLVDGVLKGAPFEKLVGKTYDGLKIEPIYVRAKGAPAIVGRAVKAAIPKRDTARIGDGTIEMAHRCEGAHFRRRGFGPCGRVVH